MVSAAKEGGGKRVSSGRDHPGEDLNSRSGSLLFRSSTTGQSALVVFPQQPGKVQGSPPVSPHPTRTVEVRVRIMIGDNMDSISIQRFAPG